MEAIVYIWAWHATALPPLRLISSRMIEASIMPSPAPPYSEGIKAASQPASLRVFTNSSGYAFFSSQLRQYSLPKRAHSAATAVRISFWLSENAKSILTLLGPTPDDRLLAGAPVGP